MASKRSPSNTASAALREALIRKSNEADRSIYGRLIEREQEHLDSCRIKKCVQCKDAKALIPYYRKRLKEELASSREHYTRLAASGEL